MHNMPQRILRSGSQYSDPILRSSLFGYLFLLILLISELRVFLDNDVALPCSASQEGVLSR